MISPLRHSDSIISLISSFSRIFASARVRPLTLNRLAYGRDPLARPQRLCHATHGELVIHLVNDQRLLAFDQADQSGLPYEVAIVLVDVDLPQPETVCLARGDGEVPEL